MTGPQRDRLAMGIAAFALAMALATVLFGSFDSGIRLRIQDGRVVVASVAQHSLANVYGVRAGMVVVALNGTTLIRLPDFVYPLREPTTDPDIVDEVEPRPIGVEPAVPTTVPLSLEVLAAMVSLPTRDLTAIEPWELDQGSAATGWHTTSIYDNGRSGLQDSMAALSIGAAILLVAGWWLLSGRAGASLRPMAIPLAIAIAVPFISRPLEATWSPPLVALAGIVMVAAMVPFAWALLERVADRNERRIVAQVTAGVAVGAALAAIVVAVTAPSSASTIARLALVGAIPLVAGLAAAGPIQLGALPGAPATSGRLLESTEFAIAGATPLMAVATESVPYVFPFVLWVGLILVTGRFTIRPLARLATRASLQRDLIVAATEAERARVAADIHDDALQELTLLVGRLDAAGDAEGAEIARTVSDRLRAICGDLRLPILDDLGLGPALDWLVLRIERLAGGEVSLEQSEGSRPPAEIELAFFRVAQEALANAVKHGRPPIVVRYSATASGASLSIDDAGPGITPEAPAEAERAGRFGLLNMAQRAEAIGAILDVRRWPAGGTHVALEWRPR
jgi:signal transduction histidine kinase